MQIDPRRLVVLGAVSRHGGVAAAAAGLHVSPSAVSQQLAMLERETGMTLVDRSRRGGQRNLQLTAAGRMMAAQAERLAEVLRDAEAELEALSEDVAGTVTISAFSTVLRGFAGAALARLAAGHPRLHLRVVEIDDAVAAAEVLSGRVDLAILEDDAAGRRAAPAGSRYEVLVDDPFRLAFPASWPDFDDLAEVAERPWVDGPQGSALAQAMKRIRASTGLAFPGRHVAREFSTALALAGSGLAGTLVPSLALAAWPPGGEVRIRVPAGVGARRLGVLYRRSRNEPTSAARTVLDALRFEARGTGRSGNGPG